LTDQDTLEDIANSNDEKKYRYSRRVQVIFGDDDCSRGKDDDDYDILLCDTRLEARYILKVTKNKLEFDFYKYLNLTVDRWTTAGVRIPQSSAFAVTEATTCDDNGAKPGRKSVAR